jgi:predicted transcriptional regulator
MHWIERQILLTLLRVEIGSAKQLVPNGVEANLASHYVRHLIAMDYIAKIERGKYTLTAEGERFVGEMNSLTGKIGKNLKSVIMLYAEDANGRPLLFQWTRQPYLSQITLPHDRVAYGASLDDALQTALTEKLGGVFPTTFLCSGLVRIMHGDVMTSHMSAFIYKATVDETKFPLESKNGIASFEFDIARAMDGVGQLVAVAQKGSRAMFDVTLRY